MKQVVSTVLGRIPAETLGICHSHEHIVLEKGQSYQINPALCIDEPSKTMVDLQEMRAAGARALADSQPVGCGRNPDTLAWLSLQSKIHIIGCTGFHKMIFYPETHWIFSKDQHYLEELFVAEIEQGMYTLCDTALPNKQTQYRAGFIKVALATEGITPQYEKLYKAAARACTKTGAPIMIHVDSATDPVAFASFLNKQGVAFGKMIFCHMDRAIPDISHHKILCKQGSFLEYDTISRDKYHSDTDEIEIIQQICHAGYASQLLLSLDVTRQRLVGYGGTPGLGYLCNNFVPLMLANGISKHDIDSFLQGNPAQAFSF